MDNREDNFDTEDEMAKELDFTEAKTLTKELSANVPSQSVETKTITGYSRMHESLNLLSFGCFAAGQHADG